MKINLLYFAFALLFMTSCNPESDPPEPVLPNDATYILVANEGAFGSDNASLTIIDREAGTITQNAFSKANDDAPLGDVLNSTVERNGEIYLVVNNSGKIEVVDADDLTSKRTITGFTSPRYICMLSDQKAYVSDLFSNSMHIINPTAGTYTGVIPTGFWVENMLQINSEVWCTAPATDQLYFVNSSIDQISDSMSLSPGVNDIAMDANHDVWVLAQGTYTDLSIEPVLYRVDVETKAILSTFEFSDSTSVNNLTMSGDGQSVLYIMEGDLYEMPISAQQLPENPFISDPEVAYYALNINPENGEIALTNAAGFTQAGSVYFYTAAGAPIDTYETGIAPHSVLWISE